MKPIEASTVYATLLRAWERHIRDVATRDQRAALMEAAERLASS